ncbi:hypothetical protein NL676_004284 [Syzygium grande]|nr:hypothetical protein NL676_004284 [Syzygium grande]
MVTDSEHEGIESGGDGDNLCLQNCGSTTDFSWEPGLGSPPRLPEVEVLRELYVARLVLPRDRSRRQSNITYPALIGLMARQWVCSIISRSRFKWIRGVPLLAHWLFSGRSGPSWPVRPEPEDKSMSQPERPIRFGPDRTISGPSGLSGQWASLAVFGFGRHCNVCAGHKRLNERYKSNTTHEALRIERELRV